MKIISFVVVLILFLSACSAQNKNIKKTAGEGQRAKTSKEAPQWFDPNKLEENDIHIAERQKSKKVEVAGAIEQKSDDKSELQKEADQIVDGFRIQLQASKSSQKMEDALKIAKDYFNPRGFEVYLVYESPLYKLRVGDATTRKHAEKILALCRQSGYRDSWIVPDMVNGALDQAED